MLSRICCVARQSASNSAARHQRCRRSECIDARTRKVCHEKDGADPALGDRWIDCQPGAFRVRCARGRQFLRQVLLSETLQSDAEVDVELIAGTKLFLRDDKGNETPLTLVKGDHAFTVSLAPNRRGVVRGLADLGVTKTGSKPHLLLYYPKTIVGDAFDARTRLGDSVPVEIIPGGTPGAVRLQLVARGKPHSGQITVIMPDGSQQMADTDDEGWTEVFSQRGRYGAWARYWTRRRVSAPESRTPRSGTTQPSSSMRVHPQRAARLNRHQKVPRLALRPCRRGSSFGAAASDGWLYVYGGHVVPTHSYSTEAVSGKFNRLRLADGKTWERLPDGPPLQGLNLAAHGGKIYRVGGMQPLNKPGEPQDIRSVADVARFDPATGKWEALRRCRFLAPLPTWSWSETRWSSSVAGR